MCTDNPTSLGSTYVGLIVVPPVGTSNEGALSAATLRAAFRAERDRGRRVRVVVLCNPNNPTGHVMTLGEARDIAAALEVSATQPIFISQSRSLTHMFVSHSRCLTLAVSLSMSHSRCLTLAVSLSLSHSRRLTLDISPPLR